MPADDGLIGTADYATGWLVLAIVLLVAVVLWNVGVAWWGRPHRRPDEAPAPPAPSGLRERYLALIDEIEADQAAGRLTLRAAHQRLSTVVRAYVGEVTGRPTETMTLRQLRESDLPMLVAVVELVYPPEFGPGEDRPDDELPRALDRARAVVEASWS